MAKVKYSSTKILQQTNCFERHRERVHLRRWWGKVTESYSLPLCLSPGFSSPPSSGMYKLSSDCFGPARPGEMSRPGPPSWQFWDQVSVGQRRTATGRTHTPPTELAWGLLLQGSVGGFQAYCESVYRTQRWMLWVSLCQCPWQVLQHICLKYGRLQNLNLSTRGQ